MIISRRRPARAQVAMEYVLSLLGAVVFFGVILRVWMWTNSTLMRRQHSFQTTRVEAGTSGGDSGMAVPYVEEPIKLLGLPGSVGGGSTPPPGGTVNGCPMQALYDGYIAQAEWHEAEAARLLEEQEPGATECVMTSPTTVNCPPGADAQAVEQLEAATEALEAKNDEIAQAEADINNANQQLLFLDPILNPADYAWWTSFKAQREADYARYVQERDVIQADVDRLRQLANSSAFEGINLGTQVTAHLNTAQQYRDLAAAACPNA